MTFRAISTALLLLSFAAAQAPQPKHPPDVPYVPTQDPVVHAMLRLAGVTNNDTVYDLGCGDGRIVVAAARDYMAHGVGIDINPQRIQEAQANAKKNAVERLVRFEENDLFDADIHSATVVTLYLLPDVNLRLRPKLLKELKPGTRVVSHSFDMGDWKPEKQEQVEGQWIYLWTVPAQQ